MASDGDSDSHLLVDWRRNLLHPTSTSPRPSPPDAKQPERRQKTPKRKREGQSHDPANVASMPEMPRPGRGAFASQSTAAMVESPTRNSHPLTVAGSASFTPTTPAVVEKASRPAASSSAAPRKYIDVVDLGSDDSDDDVCILDGEGAPAFRIHGKVEPRKREAVLPRQGIPLQPEESIAGSAFKLDQSDEAAAFEPGAEFIPSPQRDLNCSQSAPRSELRVGEPGAFRENPIRGGSAVRRLRFENLEAPEKTCKRRKRFKGERKAQAAEKQRERDQKQSVQEEKKRAREESRQDLRRQKEAAKAQGAERRKLEKELDKWMKGKFSLQNTTVQLDVKVPGMRNVGYILLHHLGEKRYKYTVESNPVERSILWKMKRPSACSKEYGPKPQAGNDELKTRAASNSDPYVVVKSQLVLEEVDVEYVVVILQGEEFASMATGGTLNSHLSSVHDHHPGYSVCYLINGLMRYLGRQETEDQMRFEVEQAVAELVTHQQGVQVRLCFDEAEIANHVIGLTKNHAWAPFKRELTSIAVQTNGNHVTRSDPNRMELRKSTWLRFLVAIPRISGPTALAIRREYPTMRALLDVYLDPSRSDHEKVSLLQDIVKDVRLGSESAGRRVGPVASRRVYLVLTARDGDLRTEDVEDGADYFRDLD